MPFFNRKQTTVFYKNGGFEKTYACALLKIEFQNDVILHQSFVSAVRNLSKKLAYYFIEGPVEF